MCRTAGVDKLPKKKGRGKMVGKRHGNKFWDTLTPHSAATMFLALRQWQSSQKAGRLIMLAEQTGLQECPFVDS